MILSRTIKQGIKMMCVQQHKNMKVAENKAFYTHTHTLLNSVEEILTNSAIYQKSQREIFPLGFFVHFIKE